MQKKFAEMEKKNQELEKELDKERERNRELEKGVKSASKEIKPEVEELLEHMDSIPLLYYEIIAYFQRFKVENRELVETSLAPPSQEK